MSGAGNDFVVVDLTTPGIAGGLPDPARFVPAISDRRRGVGADGVILIAPPNTGDFSMTYFNADGSTGSLCGNGGRCAASLMMDRLHRDQVTFETCGKTYRAERTAGGILLGMDDPGPMTMNIGLNADNHVFAGHFIDTGSPHLVIPVEGTLPDRQAVCDIGRALRYDPFFQPGGTNVNFILREGEDRIRIRTYERGVEDETWACGTGAVASAMVHAAIHGHEGNCSIGVVPLSGDLLTVRFTRTGAGVSRVSLEGPAVVTFTGTFEAAEL